MKTLSIVIPAFNEEKTIVKILNKIKGAELPINWDKEILITNDCSTDSTELAIKEYMDKNSEMDISYFKHYKNKGKGSALHTSIEHAKGDYIIIQDADLEYNPEEY